jgi:exopolyphosphatase/pppGpp-phosphohydrolase
MQCIDLYRFLGAVLGHLSAHALFNDVFEDDLLAWDSGNGSFQITAKTDNEYKVFEGPLGHGTVRVLLSQDIRKQAVLQQGQSGNPVSFYEAEKLKEKIHEKMPKIPFWLGQKLDLEKVVIGTFGDGESIFALVAKALSGNKESVEKTTITKEDVKRVIKTFIGKDDNAFDQEKIHRKTLTSAIHLQAMMEYLGVEKIEFKKAIGNTSGMIIDPELWNKKEVLS